MLKRAAVLLLSLAVPINLIAKDRSDMPALEKATFAAGCFWCIQPPFDQTDGVVRTTVGFTGGAEQNPTYHQVSAGQTGHAESIEVVFDPTRVSYEKLLDVFWHNI